jgi:hypothetical protein
MNTGALARGDPSSQPHDPDSGIDPDLRDVLDNLPYPADKWQIVGYAEINSLGVVHRRRLYHLPVRRYLSSAEVTIALSPHGIDEPE